MDEDTQQLHLLSMFHYVVAGLVGLMGCFPILHLTVGIAAVMGALNDGAGSAPPALFGWFFIVMAVAAIASMWTIAVAILFAGRKLAARSSYTYCLVMAAVECMFMPFGTVLGVFTIVVLMRPSVKQLFGYPDGKSGKMAMK
jgi:hypothetical protein